MYGESVNDNSAPRHTRAAAACITVGQPWVGERGSQACALAGHLISAHTRWMKVIDSYAARTAHEAEVVFSRWADPEGWPEWDAEVLEVTFAGPARIGARGRMRPASGPAAAFSVTAFEPGRVFTNASSLPGAKLVFEHLVTPALDGASVEVVVRVEGILAPLWKRVLDPSMGNAARSSVTGLLAHLDAA